MFVCFFCPLYISVCWLINGQIPSGRTYAGRGTVAATGNSCSLGIWVGGSFSFTVNSFVPLATMQIDYI